MRWLDGIGHQFESTLGDSERHGMLQFMGSWSQTQLSGSEQKQQLRWGGNKICKLRR